MASSGSVNFTVNRDQIVKAALRKNGVISRGTTPTAEDISEGAEALNLIVKQWMGNSDFAPGLKVWTRKRGTFFPALNTRTYTLGPNGDHATSSYVSTTLSAAEASGQTALSVTSITGISSADNLGIRLDDKTIHWTTVNGAPAGGTVTATVALPSAAAAGNAVYAYTTKLLMPLEILSLRRKSTASVETPLTPMLLAEHEAIGDKSANGTPVRYLYEPGLTDGLLFLDYGIEDTTDVYDLTFLRTVEDFDAAGDTPDYPQRWYRPLMLQLAIDLAPERGKASVIPSLMTLLHGNPAAGIQGALQIAQNADPENVVVSFEPDR